MGLISLVGGLISGFMLLLCIPVFIILTVALAIANPAIGVGMFLALCYFTIEVRQARKARRAQRRNGELAAGALMVELSQRLYEARQNEIMPDGLPRNAPSALD